MSTNSVIKFQKLCCKFHHFQETTNIGTYGDGDIIVGEDKSGVDTGQFAVARHFVNLRLLSVQVAENFRP